MAKRLFQRFLPRKARLQHTRSKWMQKALHDPNVWHLNRHRVARAMAIGLFWAWMPVPLPSLWASLTAWKLRGNVPLAFACCWLRNPFTLLPAIWVSHQVGLLITPSNATSDWTQTLHTLQSLPNEGWWQTSISFFQFFWINLRIFYPMIIGSLTLGLASGVLSFFIVQLLWRWSVAWRWHYRSRNTR